MPSQVRKFQADLLTSVKQMRRSEAARATKVKLPAAAEARASVSLSQQEFARLLGVSARTLLKVAVKHPKLLRAIDT
jgi:putative transcriptional regulator